MKPTYRFEDVCKLLLSELSYKDHARLSEILKEEKKRYPLEQLFIIRDLVLLTAKVEGLKFEIEILRKNQ